jgi:hypothetical protein
MFVGVEWGKGRKRVSPFYGSYDASVTGFS